MREIRLSGSEGGVALTRHPYPYLKRWLRGRGERVCAFCIQAGGWRGFRKNARYRVTENRGRTADGVSGLG